jgi:hypothetical protein
MTYLTAITIFHTALSLIAIPVGVGGVMRLFNPALPAFWTTGFLWTAFLTSATGFIFPFIGVTPAFIVGIVAVAILIAVYLAMGKAGALWQGIWAGGMVASRYLLVFVLIVQAFLKVAFLNQFAPTGSETPFAVVQGITLLLFLGLGVLAVRRFRVT